MLCNGNLSDSYRNFLRKYETNKHLKNHDRFLTKLRRLEEKELDLKHAKEIIKMKIRTEYTAMRNI